MSETQHLQVRVLFFGATAEVVGRRSMVLEMPHDALSRDAFHRLLELHPGLDSHKLLYSLNQVYANGSEQLKTADELAVFTAVSGG